MKRNFGYFLLQLVILFPILYWITGLSVKQQIATWLGLVLLDKLIRRYVKEQYRRIPLKKENWYFVLVLAVVIAAMCYSIKLAEHAPTISYAMGFIMGMIVMKFFIFAAMDSKQEERSDEPEKRICRAMQFSDTMVCNCGNTWDVNDAHPPACRQSGIAAHTAEIARTVATIRNG